MRKPLLPATFILAAVSYFFIYRSFDFLLALNLPVRNYNLFIPESFFAHFAIPYTFEAGFLCFMAAVWLIASRAVTASPNSDNSSLNSMSAVISRAEWLAVVAAVGVCLCAHALLLTDTAYAIRGIEAGFYFWARGLLEGHAPCQPPCCSGPGYGSFFGAGVYCDHPMGFSYYQMIFLAIFGPSLWSWRFSTVCFSLSGAIPLYLLMRNLVSVRAAWISMVTYLASYYHFQWAQVGYNNIHFVTPLLWSWALLLIAIKSERARYAVAAGAAASAGIYLNYISLSLPFFGFVILACRAYEQRTRENSKSALGKLSAGFALGCFVTAAPFIWHLYDHVGIATHFGGADSEVHSIYDRIRNVLQSAMYPFIVANVDLYYLNQQLFDFFTLFLAAIGIIYCYRMLHAGKEVSYWKMAFLINLVVFVVTMGFFNRYMRPATTRLLFYIPMLAIFAGYGFDAFRDWFDRKRAGYIFSLMMTCILCANIRMITYGIERSTEAFNPVQYLLRQSAEANFPAIYVGQEVQASWKNMNRAIELHGLQNKLFVMDEDKIDATKIQSLVELHPKLLLVDLRSDNAPRIVQELAASFPLAAKPLTRIFKEGGPHAIVRLN